MKPQFEFEGLLMDGSLHYRGRDNMYTINLSDDVKSAVPLLAAACLEGHATVNYKGRAFRVIGVHIDRTRRFHQSSLNVFEVTWSPIKPIGAS